MGGASRESSCDASTRMTTWGLVDQWSVALALGWKIVPKPNRAGPSTLSRMLRIGENLTYPS